MAEASNTSLEPHVSSSHLERREIGGAAIRETVPPAVTSQNRISGRNEIVAVEEVGRGDDIRGHSDGSLSRDDLFSVGEIEEREDTGATLDDSMGEVREKEESDDVTGPLSILMQGPDGALFVGTERAAMSTVDLKPMSDSEDGAIEDVTVFNFAPASLGTAFGLEAVHIVFPEPPSDSNPVSAEMYALEAVLTPRSILAHVRRKRLFLVLLLIGSGFYMSVFFAALGNQDRDRDDNNGGDISHFLDNLAENMLAYQPLWLSTAYLVLYLTLDMIALSGTLLDNGHLLTFYILIQTIFACISALNFRPFLIFRIVIILMAYQVRNGIFAIQSALRRLHLRVTGVPLPSRFGNIWTSMPMWSISPRNLVSRRNEHRERPGVREQPPSEGTAMV